MLGVDIGSLALGADIWRFGMSVSVHTSVWPLVCQYISIFMWQYQSMSISA